MKKLILILSLLSGCATSTFQNKEVLVQNAYIIRTATAEQKTLPPYPTPIDVTKADQTALAEWIVESEKRQLDLESIIRRLIEFYEAPASTSQPSSK